MATPPVLSFRVIPPLDTEIEARAGSFAAPGLRSFVWLH